MKFTFAGHTVPVIQSCSPPPNKWGVIYFFGWENGMSYYVQAIGIVLFYFMGIDIVFINKSCTHDGTNP